MEVTELGIVMLVNLINPFAKSGGMHFTSSPILIVEIFVFLKTNPSYSVP
jgi:hypothetical protein